jgi:hypothetical protein
MRSRVVSGAVAGLVALSTMAISDSPPATAAVANREIVSVAVNGVPDAKTSTLGTSVSGDGRFAVFTALDGADDDGVFVRDRQTKTTIKVPNQGITVSAQPVTFLRTRLGEISRDGCHVVFGAEFGPSQNVRAEVFAWDRCAEPNGPAHIVSQTGQDDLFDLGPAVSSNGRFVAFSLVSIVNDSPTFRLFVADRDFDGNGSFAGSPKIVEMPSSRRSLRGAQSPAFTDEFAGGAQLGFVTDVDPTRSGAPVSRDNVFLWSTVGMDVANPARFRLVSNDPALDANDDSEAFDVAVSGPGDVVAYTWTPLFCDDGCTRGTRALTVKSPARTTPVSVVVGGFAASLSQDGSQLAFGLGDCSDGPASAGIVRAKNGVFDGKAVEDIKPDPASNERINRFCNPVLSSTGRTVVFEASPASGADASLGLRGRHDFAQDRPPLVTVTGLEFGDVLLGASNTRTATLTNAGPSSFVVGTISTSGDFSVIGGSCRAGLQVVPGASCSVEVQFAPAQEGGRAATLTVRENGFLGARADGGLAGTGIAPAPPPTTTTTTTAPLQTTTTTVKPTTTTAPRPTTTVPRPTTTAPGTTTTTPGTTTTTPRPTTTSPPQTLPTAPPTTTTTIPVPPNAPRLLVSPGVAPQGSVVIAVGTGFDAREVVTLTWDSVPGTFVVRADEAGSFTTSVTILHHERLGGRRLVVAGRPEVSAPLLVTLATLQPNGTLVAPGHERLVTRG